MTATKTILARLRIDVFLLLLIVTIGIAVILPARGVAGIVADKAVYVAVAALFFLYGARLSPGAVLAGIGHWRLQSVVFLSTFALFPLVGLAVTAATRHLLPHDLMLGILYLCLLPSTVQSSIAFTSIARGNVPAALCSASLSNLLGVIVTPVLVALLLPSTGGGFSLGGVGDIALQIMLPFFAGQVLRPWLGAWIIRHKTLTSVVDRGSILLVVYAAFSAGMVAGVWTSLSPADLLSVLLIDLVILGIVIVATVWSSKRLGFNVEDQIAIIFCGSKKSLASGIPMAIILFPGHSVSLIVLPLMLFHQAQLFVCATLARHYAARNDPSPAVSADLAISQA